MIHSMKLGKINIWVDKAVLVSKVYKYKHDTSWKEISFDGTYTNERSNLQVKSPRCKISIR